MSQAISTPKEHLEQITLYHPIQRKAGLCEQLTLHEPTAGELRGIRLIELMQLEPPVLDELLPRIADPVLTKAEIAALRPTDVFQILTRLAGFFMPKA